MKTKDLIKLLQELDPTGEIECSIGNAGVCGANVEPAYYDGLLQLVERDEEGHAISGKFTSKGRKLEIDSESIDDAIFNDENFPVNFDEIGNEAQKERYIKFVQERRERTIQINHDVDKGFFIRYIKEKYPNISTDNADEYYEKNLHYNDVMPKEILEKKDSWNNRRKEQWDNDEKITTFFTKEN